MSTPTTTAVLIDEDGRASLKTFDSRPLGDHELRVENAYTAVSVGTEYLITDQKLIGCTYPCLLGYQGAGRVIEIGSAVEGYAVGDRVCSGHSSYQPAGFGQGAGNAHQSHPIVPEVGDWAQTRLAKVPEGVSDAAAAYAWMVSVSMQGIEMARPALGEVVAVVGLGLVGQFAAQLARASGANVYACDIDAHRAQLADEHAADVVVAGDTAALNDRLRADHPGGADVVIECSGNTKVLDAAIDLAGQRARFVIQGHYHGQVSFRYLAAHTSRLTMVCPCGWGDLSKVLPLLADGRVVVEPYRADPVAATEEGVGGLYRRIKDRDPQVMAALIDWRASS